MSEVREGTLHRPWSLRQLVGELRSGQASSQSALARARDRIAATEPEIHAWEELPDSPPGSTYPGPLAGVPLAVKDIIDVAGLPTRCGSSLRADAPPARADAEIVRAWRGTGAVPLGKTVTTEFAYFAPGPTRNPAAPGHTPGGSSSGSAAAVSSGQVPLALGSQTAGSVTRPAAFCGVASLVMSRGRFSGDGVAGLSASLDSHGAFTATVSDLALAWSALTGTPDEGQAPPAGPPRVLVWTAEPFDVAPAMREAVERTRSQLAARGATVADLPDEQLVAEVTAAHPVVMAYEAARERAAELASADRLSTPLATLLRTGAATSDADYRQARRVIRAAVERIVRLLAPYDVVLGPAALGPAPAGLEATGDPVLSRAWQALGLPVVTVPGCTDDGGLPLGLQVVGRPSGESQLLAAACGIERLLSPGGRDDG